MNSKIKPIVVTMGEPSGIASEIIIKVWLQRKKKNIFPFILVDDLEKLKKVNNFFNLKAKFISFNPGQDVYQIFEKYIPVVDLKANINFTHGLPSKVNSKFVLRSINTAVDLILKKKHHHCLLCLFVKKH